MAFVPTADGGGYVYYGPAETTLRLKSDGWKRGMANDPGYIGHLLDLARSVKSSGSTQISCVLPCPTKAWSMAILGAVLLLGLLGWLVVILKGRGDVGRIFNPSPAVCMVIPASACLLVLHEWAHAMALRSIGGKAGRTLLRRQFPTIITEVGPVHYLPPWPFTWVVGAGMAVEASVLGVACAAYVVGLARLVAEGLIIFECISLPLSAIPWRGSDGHRLLRRWKTRREEACAR